MHPKKKNYNILTFLMYLVHGGMASFCLRESTSREFPPFISQKFRREREKKLKYRAILHLAPFSGSDHRSLRATICSAS